jgi:hypothetical protein
MKKGILRNNFVSMLFVFVVLIGLVFSSMGTSLGAAYGDSLDTLEPTEIGLVICGDAVENGVGFTGDMVYLTHAEVENAADNKDMTGTMLADCWTSAPVMFSAYENHGTPVTNYRYVEGIDLQKVLVKLGFSGTEINSLSATVESGKNSVGRRYAVGVNDFAANSRVYFPSDGSSAQSVSPVLAFYETLKEGSEDFTTPVKLNDATYIPHPTFIFGQKEQTESNNCSCVKNAEKLTIGDVKSALKISVNGTLNKQIELSEIVLMGRYHTEYSYIKDGATVTHQVDGVPLSKLLNEYGVNVTNPNAELTFSVLDPGAELTPWKSRTVKGSEIDQCFVAYDAKDANGAITDNTPLRVYCPGSFGNEVLIRNVAALSIVNPAGGGGGSGETGLKQPGSPSTDTVFYVAVKESAGSESKFYYYTLDELKAKYDTTEQFIFDNHSVAQTVNCKGFMVEDILKDLTGATLSDSMIIQYAEQDGYHASSDNAIYVDTIASIQGRMGNKPMITYAINEQPDANKVNDPEGVYKDADGNSGYLRAYRNTGNANSVVMKGLMGIVVSDTGKAIDGKCGYTIEMISEKNPDKKVTADQVVYGCMPGMEVTVKAPTVVNCQLAAGEEAYHIITVPADNAAPANTVVTFKYQENNYFYVKNSTTGTTQYYTYTDLVKLGQQVPGLPDPALTDDDGLDNNDGSGYGKPMYYRYNGVYASQLIENLTNGTGTVNSVAFVDKDAVSHEVDAAGAGDYFVAYNNTQSKSATNTPEGKRVTKAYPVAKVILPATGSLTDDVDVLTANAAGIVITTTGGSGDSGSKPVYTITPATDPVYQNGATNKGIKTMTVNNGVSGMIHFAVQVTPVTAHNGSEAVVFVHLRNGVQLSINVTKADFDVVHTAQAGFNVQAGDVVKAYIVDDLTNDVDFNPTVLQVSSAS